MFGTLNLGNLSVGAYTSTKGVRYRFANVDAAMVASAMTPYPSRARCALIDTLVGALVTAGAWPKALVFYLLAGHSQAADLIDWKHPGNATYTLTVSGSPTVTKDRGIKGDGTAACLLGPTWAAIKALGWGQNNHAAMVWSATGFTDSISAMATDTASQPFGIAINVGGGNCALRSSSATSNNVSLGGGSTGGCRGVTRNASGTYNAWVEKTKTAVTQASASVPADAAKLSFLRAGTTTFDTNELIFGALFTYLNDTEYQAVYDAVAAYLSGLEALSNADLAWSWFNDPRAIAVGSSSVVASGTTAAGDIAAVVVGSDGTVSRTLLAPSFAVDDHNGGTLLRRSSDSKLMTWYNPHNGSTFYQHVSTNADDGSAWASGTNIATQLDDGGITTFSYSAIVQLSGESGKLFNFFRCGAPGNWGWGYSTSTNEGTTWSAATLLTPQGTQRPYTKVVQNGASRIDLICNDGHPSEATNNSLYHYYYQGGNFYKSDGTVLTSGPWTPASSFTRIWDGSSASGESWVHDVVIDAGTSRPVVGFAVFPTTTDHRCRVGWWNGSSWQTAEVCALGGPLYAAETYYSGGMSIDPEDTNTIYVSRETNGIHQIWKYTSVDGKLTWSGVQITFGDRDCFRPYVVRGARKLAYIEGRYTTYSDFNTRLRVIAI